MATLAFIPLVMLLATVARRISPRWAGRSVWAASGAAILLYGLWPTTLLAALALVGYHLLLLALDEWWGEARARGVAWLRALGLASLAGAAPIAVAQIQARFAEEEFFVALQAGILAAVWLAAWVGYRGLARRWGPGEANPRAGPYPRIARLGALSLLVALCLGGAGYTLARYQESFYTAQAPAYEGIHREQPFVVGPVRRAPHEYDGVEVFNRLIAAVARNPYKGACEFSMLALATGQPAWANAFRAELLREAEAGLFTGPAQSVKIGQYHAALRVYYYGHMRAAFPALFAAEEHQALKTWFQAINRRALTVEWVDWMYGMAFAKWPEGLYENQENGAGLLALLEVEQLSADAEAARNQDYLQRNPRGWAARVRVTDDAIIYQPEWITNALFQAHYTGQVHPTNQRLAFEWLLLQALPDGSRLRYNHPAAGSLAGAAYLGARLLGDGRYIWLAGRALDDLEARGDHLYAQPGVEAPVALRGRAPEQGSALLYGDAGLPNQVGPLAPDKLVLRAGWEPDAGYLLLNLRFTGWHRYKATNTVTLLYRAGSLAMENIGGRSFGWLPTGRSLFRDKRIPRENLNGLLIPRTGLSAVLRALTGIGGPWAQDPPHYARVEQFTSGAAFDYARTRLDDWHGWSQQREVYFYPQGPVVVVDRAHGPADQRAALAWHLPQESTSEGQRFILRRGAHPAEMLLLALDDQALALQSKPEDGDPPQLGVLCRASRGGRLDVATVFLLDAWAGAEVNLRQTAEGRVLELRQGERELRVSLSAP